MTTVRDKLWIWGQQPNGHCDYNLGGSSKMSALEGAMYLGIPNCCRVVLKYGPRPPFDQDSLALTPMKQVVWSIIGAGGAVFNDDGWGDLDEVLRQAEMFPNIVGGILDDFLSERRRGIFPPERLREIRERLRTGATRPLELWTVLYEHELLESSRPFLAECDGITFWTWKAEHLAELESNMERVRALAPGKRHLMGIYFFDYGNNRPMPLECLQAQCRKGLEWMQDGTLDGLIFCSNCCADLGLETVSWGRDWIAEVGDIPLP